jgi:outer membrane cobalamin receptor
MPTFNDSYYTLLGSTNLKPEYVKEYNIGLTLQKDFEASFKSLTFKLDAYRNEIKDKITAIPKSFRWTMLNLGQVDIMGIDFGIGSEVSLSKELSADFSINNTFQKALDKTPGSNLYGMDIPYSPRNSGSLHANLNYRSWIFSSASQYSGGRYHSFQNIPANKMDEWFLQDFSLSYLLKLKGHEMRIKGEVNNSTNVDYVILENYPMPGRSYRLSLHINL